MYTSLNTQLLPHPPMAILLPVVQIGHWPAKNIDPGKQHVAGLLIRQKKPNRSIQ